MAFVLGEEKIHSDVLEIPVVDHCNFSCSACDHLSPIAAKKSVSLAELGTALSLLAPVYHAKTVRILGGEPTLRTDLPELLAVVRESKIADTIRIVTNGSLLHRFTDEVLGLIQSVEVAEYPGMGQGRERLRAFQDTCARQGVRLLVKNVSTFRIPHSEQSTNNAQLVKRIYTACSIAHDWGCHTLYDGYFFKCSRAALLDRRVLGLERYESGLRLAPEVNLSERLSAYLGETKEPLAACRACLGTVGKTIVHAQISRDAWRSAHHEPLEELVDDAYLGRYEAEEGPEWDCFTLLDHGREFPLDEGFDGSRTVGGRE